MISIFPVILLVTPCKNSCIELPSASIFVFPTNEMVDVCFVRWHSRGSRRANARIALFKASTRENIYVVTKQ